MYEAHHHLRFSDEAITACVKFASQYIQDRFLPDKAIDIMDETGARVQLKTLKTIPEAAQTVRTELRAVQAEKEAAIRVQDYALAGEHRVREVELQKKVVKIMAEEDRASKELLGTHADDQAPTDISALVEPLVTENDVAQVVSCWSGVPVEKVSADESVRLVALEKTLHNRVIGQEEAVVAVSKAVRRARAGLKNPNRPIASFIFCGPTGVGKTELCKALAAAYFGKEESMIRLDMSEFMERHTVSKLIGSPPGYVGYDDETQLCDRIRRNPYSLILFDEIEKAHPDIFNIMLQILEDGRLTDSKGRVVSFKNALIIMTSNVGAQNIQKNIEGGGGFGFQSNDEDAEKVGYEKLKSKVMEQLKNNFKPEFINRLDETIVFSPLTKTEIEQIAELEFKKVFSRIAEQGITIELTERFKKKVVDEGFDPQFGARPLRRAIGKMLEDELSSSFLTQPIVEGEIAIIDVDDEGKVIVMRNMGDGEEAAPPVEVAR